MIPVKAPVCEKLGRLLHCGWLSKEDTIAPDDAKRCRGWNKSGGKKGATSAARIRVVAMESTRH